MSTIKDYSVYCGRKYDAITVLDVLPREFDSKGRMKPARFKVRCDCGNIYDTSANDVLAGRIHSCKKHRGKSYEPANFLKSDLALEAREKYNCLKENISIVERLQPQWYCKCAEDACAISAVCNICCCECDKKQCEKRCLNNPEKCGGSRRRKKNERKKCKA